MKKRCSKETARERVETICDLIGLGLTNAQIRRHPKVLEWGIQRKQVGAYIKRAVETLKRRLESDVQGALGKAQKQFDTLYSLAVKDKKLGVALQAVTAGLKLKGVALTGRGSAHKSKDSELSPDAIKESCADQTLRLAEVIELESQGGGTTLRLLMNGMPAAYFRVADILLLQWQLSVLVDCHLSELIQPLVMLQRALRMTSVGEPAGWLLIARMCVYAYQSKVAAWNEFTRSLGIDSAHLLKDHPQTATLANLWDPLVEQPVSRQELHADLASGGGNPPRLVTVADLVDRWTAAFQSRRGR